MNLRKIIWVFLALSILYFASCVKNMDEAYIPSYISIDKIAVLTNGEQGSSSSYITDAWVYVDGKDMGAYQLPTKIPILTQGKHTIKVAPGIKLNGVSETRVPYPMVEPDIMEVDLIKDSVRPLTVNCQYFSTSKFALIEDYESINLAFEPTQNNTAEWRNSDKGSDPASYIFEGNHSGLGVLDEDNNRLQLLTKQMFEQLPKKGTPVFIELNFKCNTTIVLSLMSYKLGIGESTDVINLNPTDEWKKIYVNLTSTLSYDVNNYQYKFLISAYHNHNVDESIVLIDNFKIVYRDIE